MRERGLTDKSYVGLVSSFTEIMNAEGEGGPGEEVAPRPAKLTNLNPN